MATLAILKESLESDNHYGNKPSLGLAEFFKGISASGLNNSDLKEIISCFKLYLSENKDGISQFNQKKLLELVNIFSTLSVVSRQAFVSSLIYRTVVSFLNEADIESNGENEKNIKNFLEQWVSANTFQVHQLGQVIRGLSLEKAKLFFGIILEKKMGNQTDDERQSFVATIDAALKEGTAENIVEKCQAIVEMWLKQKSFLLDGLIAIINKNQGTNEAGLSLIIGEWLKQNTLTMEKFIEVINKNQGTNEAGLSLIIGEWLKQKPLAMEKFIEVINKNQETNEAGWRVFCGEWLKQNTLTMEKLIETVNKNFKTKEKTCLVIIEAWLKNSNNEKISELINKLAASKTNNAVIQDHALFDKLIKKEISTRNLVDDDNWRSNVKENLSANINVETMLLNNKQTLSLDHLYQDVVRGVKINGNGFNKEKTMQEILQEEKFNSEEISKLKYYNQGPMIITNVFGHIVLQKMEETNPDHTPVQSGNEDSIFCYNLMPNNSEKNIHKGQDNSLYFDCNLGHSFSTTINGLPKIPVNLPIEMKVESQYIFAKKGVQLLSYKTEDPLVFSLLTNKKDKQPDIVKMIENNMQEIASNPNFAKIFCSQWDDLNSKRLDNADLKQNWQDYFSVPKYRNLIAKNFNEIYKEIILTDAKAVNVFVEMCFDIMKNGAGEDKATSWRSFAMSEGFISFLHKETNKELISKLIRGNLPANKCISTIMSNSSCGSAGNLIAQLVSKDGKKTKKKSILSLFNFDWMKKEQLRKNTQAGDFVRTFIQGCSVSDLHGLIGSISNASLKAEAFNLFLSEQGKNNKQRKYSKDANVLKFISLLREECSNKSLSVVEAKNICKTYLSVCKPNLSVLLVASILGLLGKDYRGISEEFSNVLDQVSKDAKTKKISYKDIYRLTTIEKTFIFSTLFCQHGMDKSACAGKVWQGLKNVFITQTLKSCKSIEAGIPNLANMVDNGAGSNFFNINNEKISNVQKESTAASNVREVIHDILQHNKRLITLGGFIGIIKRTSSLQGKEIVTQEYLKIHPKIGLKEFMKVFVELYKNKGQQKNQGAIKQLANQVKKSIRQTSITLEQINLLKGDVAVFYDYCLTNHLSTPEELNKQIEPLSFQDDVWDRVKEIYQEMLMHNAVESFKGLFGVAKTMEGKAKTTNDSENNNQVKALPSTLAEIKVNLQGIVEKITKVDDFINITRSLRVQPTIQQEKPLLAGDNIAPNVEGEFTKLAVAEKYLQTANRKLSLYDLIKIVVDLNQADEPAKNNKLRSQTTNEENQRVIFKCFEKFATDNPGKKITLAEIKGAINFDFHTLDAKIFSDAYQTYNLEQVNKLIRQEQPNYLALLIKFEDDATGYLENKVDLYKEKDSVSKLNKKQPLSPSRQPMLTKNKSSSSWQKFLALFSIKKNKDNNINTGTNKPENKPENNNNQNPVSANPHDNNDTNKIITLSKTLIN